MPGIFISYRRDDSAAITGRIFDRLSAHFGAGRVFMDIDSIPIGHDFRDHIGETLQRCDVVLAVVGRRWTGPLPERGRRIDDPADLVRLELEGGLSREIPVVPVLVEGASTPSPLELPESLRGFSYRNAATVDSGKDFHPHVDRLIRDIEALVERRSDAGDKSGAEAVPPPRAQQRPPRPAAAPAAAAPAAARAKSRLLPWAAVLLAIGAVGFALLSQHDNEPDSLAGYGGILVFELVLVACGAALGRRWRDATGQPATAATVTNGLFVLSMALFTLSLAIIPADGASAGRDASDGLAWAGVVLTVAGIAGLLWQLVRQRRPR
jgi:protein-S-isoprenylcysteine O-methyltransferase Ste14